MTAEVQHELDATRQELRRGVLDLPKETSETAEAMRRVVSDQIRALKELAALVADSGASFDVAEPAAAAGGVGGGRWESAPPRAPEPPPFRAPRGDSRAARGDGHAARSRAGDGRGGDRHAARGDAARADRRAGAVARAGPVASQLRPLAPTASAQPAPDRGQPGWLSNLLAAASRDDETEAPPPPRPPETLDQLTEGVAGLIDNAAAMEMWDRWRRGDPTAVSRRLYTEAGQQAFDEIRRRYRSDPQFRETAARYTQEFERLLANVSQSDRDGTQWRTYLLSNAGKVYTILAHASGRLG